MVFFLTGVPGSGKTYYLVDYAEKQINKVDKKTNEKLYLQVVHNISGYKNGFYVDFETDYLPKIIELNAYYMSIKKDINKDDLLIKKAEDLGLYKILLIVDECHLYFINDFSEKGKVRYYALLWFISYHRHLYIDIVLATQNLSLVDYKFKAFAEYFVKAIPASMRFNINPFSAPKFTYNYFPDSKMWNETKYKTEKIMAEKKIFDLYTSGDAVKKQKVYLQTLGLIALSLLAMAFLWFLFQRSFVSAGSSAPKTHQKQAPESTQINKPSVTNTDTASHSKSHLNRQNIKKKEILDFANPDLQFDVVTCDGASCSSHLTTKKIHYFFFKKMLSLKMIETVNYFSQYGIETYYIILHLSKDSYLEKFLIHSNVSKDRQKPFKMDFSRIKDDYRKVIAD